MPSLEELGVEDWGSRVLERLVPAERPVAVWANPATWSLSGLAGPRRLGVRRSGLVVLDADDVRERHALFSALAYDDETAPQFLLVPTADGFPIEPELATWCADADRWRNPCALVPTRVERIVARFTGWLHAAVSAPVFLQVLKDLEEQASEWGLQSMEAPAEWAWVLR